MAALPRLCSALLGCLWVGCEFLRSLQTLTFAVALFVAADFLSGIMFTTVALGLSAMLVVSVLALRLVPT